MPANLAPGVYPVVFTVGTAASPPLNLTVGSGAANAQFTIPPVGNDMAATDAARGPVRLYPAWQAALPAAASTSRLFDLLLNSGAVPPSHVEGAQNAKEVDRRDR